ncbi:MAG: hypothetical protein ABR520_02565 [Mycobacteriales bacterium]
MDAITAGRLVRRVDALAADMTPRQIDRRVLRREWIVLRRGVYLTGDLGEPRTVLLDRAAAALHRLGDAVISHETAALIHGFKVLVEPAAILATRPLSATRSPACYPLLRVRTAGLVAADVVEMDGIRVTNAARTIADVARCATFRAGVVTADLALHAANVSKDDVRLVLGGCVRWPGVRRARDVVDFADGLAESPHESVSRVVLVREHGVPAPELQVVLGDDTGTTARVDMLWRAQRTIGEADGMSKYTSPEVLRAEKLRQEWLEEDVQYGVVRWTPLQIGGHPERVVRRIYASFDRNSLDLTG